MRDYYYSLELIEKFISNFKVKLIVTIVLISYMYMMIIWWLYEQLQTYDDYTITKIWWLYKYKNMMIIQLQKYDDYMITKIWWLYNYYKNMMIIHLQTPWGDVENQAIALPMSTPLMPPPPPPTLSWKVERHGCFIRSADKLYRRQGWVTLMGGGVNWKI